MPEQKRARPRKPCRGCGGPKDRTGPVSYCQACFERRGGSPSVGLYSDEPCMVCGEPVALTQKGAQRVACDRPECRSELQRALAGRVGRVIQARREHLRGERECATCGVPKPLDTDHFPPIHNGTAFRRVCRPCWNEANWAKRKEALHRLKEEDPERYAEMLADDRIYYRARQMEAGRTPVKRHRTAAGAWRASVGHAKDSELAEPLALWAEAALAQDGRERAEIAAAMGVDDRAFRRAVGREYEHCTVGAADALIWGYGKAVRIPRALVERRLAELAETWRSAPGNGERLIGYLSDAEQIAHLAGAVIVRVEDLWPSLEAKA